MRRDWRERADGGLVAVLGLAFALRLAAVLWLADTSPYTDYFYYHEAGRLQAQDWSFLFRHDTVERYGKLNWWPPGYPLFLACLYSLVGPSFRAAVFLQVLLGTLVCGLVFAIGRRAAGRDVGLVAALLVAVNPTYVFTTNLVASENLFVLWLALALWLAGRRSPRARHAALAGAAFGLATLTRAVSLFLPLVVAPWLRRRAPGGAAAAWLLAGSALTIAPWTLRNALVTGTPALVCFGGGLNFYLGHNDSPPGYRELATTPLAGLGDAAAIDRKGYELGFAWLAAHPLRFATRGGRKLGALFAPPTYALHANSAIPLPDAKTDPSAAPLAAAKRARQAAKDGLLHGLFKVLAALHTYVLLAATLAACTLGWRRLPGELRLAALVLLYWIVAHVVFWAQPRFRYPMEIPMALLAAWALVWLKAAAAPNAGGSR